MFSTSQAAPQQEFSDIIALAMPLWREDDKGKMECNAITWLIQNCIIPPPLSMNLEIIRIRPWSNETEFLNANGVRIDRKRGRNTTVRTPVGRWRDVPGLAVRVPELYSVGYTNSSGGTPNGENGNETRVAT